MFSNELTDYRDTLPDKDENDKLLEQYQQTKTEAKAILTRPQQMISRKGAEQEEKEKQLVQRGKEKQFGDGTEKQRETNGDKC